MLQRFGQARAGRVRRHKASQDQVSHMTRVAASRTALLVAPQRSLRDNMDNWSDGRGARQQRHRKPACRQPAWPHGAGRRVPHFAAARPSPTPTTQNTTIDLPCSWYPHGVVHAGRFLCSCGVAAQAVPCRHACIWLLSSAAAHALPVTWQAGTAAVLVLVGRSAGAPHRIRLCSACHHRIPAPEAYRRSWPGDHSCWPQSGAASEATVRVLRHRRVRGAEAAHNSARSTAARLPSAATSALVPAAFTFTSIQTKCCSASSGRPFCRRGRPTTPLPRDDCCYWSHRGGVGCGGRRATSTCTHNSWWGARLAGRGGPGARGAAGRRCGRHCRRAGSAARAGAGATRQGTRKRAPRMARRLR